MHGQNGVYDRLMEHLGDCLPNRLPEALDRLVEHMQDIEELSPATINRHIAMIKAALHEAHRRRVEPSSTRWIPEHYLEDYPVLNENNVRFRMLSDEERQRLWEHLSEPTRRIYLFALLVPVRLSELVNLTRENLNQISGFISIPKTKNGFARTIKIPDAFIPIFRNIDSRATNLFHDENFKALGYWSEERQRLQFNRNDEFRQALKDCGISGYNFHKTRQESVMRLWATKKPYDNTWFTEDEIMLIGGWKSREAFYHYFNREIALQIRIGAYKFDQSCVDRFSEELQSKAA